MFPRDKCCGDGLTAGALRHLEHLGVLPTAVPSWKPVRDVYIATPKGVECYFPLPSDSGQFAATATRMELDAALVDAAIAAGITVQQGTTLEAIELYDDRVQIATDHGDITTDWCIAADGMWSPTRKALAMTPPGYLGEWHAFRQYWTNVSPRAAQDLFVWFEPDILPGYVWSFPLPDGRANIGFGVQRSTHKANTMNDLWKSILQRPHIRDIIGPDAVPEAPHRAWPIPARVGELPLTAHRTFFVGDAAAACDPMTGEGIGQALQTGIAAAEAIVAGGDPVVAAQTYETATEHELAVDMRFAAQLAPVLGNNAGAEFALKTAALTNWTSRNFARWLFEDYPRALLGTPRRWSKDMFHQPGAYRSR